MLCMIPTQNACDAHLRETDVIGIYYSAAFNDFYVMGVHRMIPPDAIWIEPERYASLLAQRRRGARIIANLAGQPMALLAASPTEPAATATGSAQ